DDMALMLITHDLAVVSRMADTIAVMQAGQVVETGPAANLIGAPQQRYTQTLLAATTHVSRRPVRKTGGEVLLRVDGAVKDYPLGHGLRLRARRAFRALDGVGLTVARG